MSEAILVALITGGLSLAGVVLTNMSSSRKVESTLEKHQAVTDTKIEELTREVREHNNFAKRMPTVENEIKHLNDAVEELKSYHKPTTYGGKTMETLKKNLANLVKVKTIGTLIVLTVFAVLALNGGITPDDVKDIVYIVIAFYYGTQHEKKE